MKAIISFFIVFICFAINTCASTFNMQKRLGFSKLVVSKTDTTRYQSLIYWVENEFDKTNRNQYFDTLCLVDCISVTFQVSPSGNIVIKRFSKFIPQTVKLFLEKTFKNLNALPISQKPFVQNWLKSKYANRLIMQPILISFFAESCEKQENISGRGILSLLTKESDSGKPGIGSGMMLMGGDFNVKPFDGILLTPFSLSSPYH